jgi:hypothetical protein
MHYRRTLSDLVITLLRHKNRYWYEFVRLRLGEYTRQELSQMPVSISKIGRLPLAKNVLI